LKSAVICWIKKRLGEKSMKSDGKSTGRFYAVSVFIIAILAFASISAAFGQERSSDRDKPTILTSNKVEDDLDGTDSQYFYKFTAGPGKLTLTFEVKASGTNAGAILALFDAKARPLLSDVLAQGVDGGSERQVNSVQLSSKQNLLLSIKALKYGDSGGRGTYTVTLDGPVTFAPAPAPPAAPAPAAAPDPGNGEAATATTSGFLDPTDERMLFHKVNINGPGQVTFSFSVKATGAKAAAKFAVLTDTNKQPVDAFQLQPGESTSKPVTFDKAQTLIIMVIVSKVPGNVDRGAYSVQLSGPARFEATPVGSNSLSGQLDPERAAFHLANVNSAGQVSISFNVKATNANAAAKFGVSTGKGEIVLPALDVKGGESFTKPLTFDKAQTITIFVQAVKPPDNGKDPVTYSIQVSGPVTVVR
jgi:hypothetical protein